MAHFGFTDKNVADRARQLIKFYEARKPLSPVNVPW
jgi:hypothetical protein